MKTVQNEKEVILTFTKDELLNARLRENYYDRDSTIEEYIRKSIADTLVSTIINDSGLIEEIKKQILEKGTLELFIKTLGKQLVNKFFNEIK